MHPEMERGDCGGAKWALVLTRSEGFLVAVPSRYIKFHDKVL